MKISLPLTLRRALLALVAASPFSGLSPASDVAYYNPESITVTQDLDFTGEFHSEDDGSSPRYRLFLESSEFSLLPATSDNGLYSVIFDLGGALNDAVGARAVKMGSSTLEIGYMDTVSFSNYYYHAYDGLVESVLDAGNGGAIYAGDDSFLYFHNNKTLLFDSNNAYAGGGAIYLENSDLTIENNESVIFSNNGAETNEPGLPASGWNGGGAIYAVINDSQYHCIRINSNDSVSFVGNVNDAGGAIYASGTYMKLYFSGNGTVSFSGNQATTTGNGGGAIYFKGGEEASLDFQDNETITFSENTSASQGGAVYSYAVTAFTDNDSISFVENQGSYGGALYNNSYSTTFSGNASVTFSGNTATSEGGAIYGGTSDNPLAFENNTYLTFTDNQAEDGGAIWSHYLLIEGSASVEFSGNAATGGEGGALLIRGSSTSDGLIIQNNENVLFSGNSGSSNGGACCARSGSMVNQFNNNGSLVFSENSAGQDGGALYVRAATLTFEDNESLIFQGNTAGESGGAIYVTNGVVSIANNGSVLFQNNSAGESGGAIWLEATDSGSHSLSIAGNHSVTFRSNYVKEYDEEGNLAGAVLNGITSTNLKELSTGADGGTITFYDSVQVGEDSNISEYHNLNTYEDSEGNTVTGTGTIAFTGLYAEEDLTAIFDELGLDTSGDTFQSCLETSLTSSITTRTVTLCGGTLSVSDNAILNILSSSSSSTKYGSYTAEEGSSTKISNHGTLNIASNATFNSSYLSIDNAAMTVGGSFTSTGGYSLLSGGTLDIAGSAALEDYGFLMLQSGSSVAAGGDFTVGESCRVSFSWGDNTLTAEGDIVFQSGSSLQHISTSDTSTLKASSVTMTGTDLSLWLRTDGYALIVDGDLSLTDSTLWLSPGTGSGTFCGIDVTGALSVSGTTTINLSSDYVDLAGEDGVNITLFRLRGDAVGDGFTGDVSGWTLQSWTETETWDPVAGDYVDTFTALENGTLTTALLSDETGETTWGVILQLTADSSGGGDDDGDIYVYTGENVSITDLTKKVHIVGGTLDAAGVSADTALSSEVIVEGTDGLLIMTEDQTLNLTGSLTGDSSVGYDVQGEDGGSAGTIGIGTAGGSLSGTAVELTGESYAVNALEVRSGIATIAESAGLGHELTEITVGTASGETTSAILVNRGAVNGKTVEVLADGSVTNYGTITAADSVTLDGGAAMANTAGGELSAQSIAVNADAALSNAGTITAVDSVTLDGGAAVTNTAGGELSAQSIAVNADAALSNAGTITGDISLAGSMTNSGVSTGTITVLDGGSLSGGGTFGNVDVQNGGTLDVQGAAGFSSLTVGDGSKITFSVNGVTPYSSGMSASETYSHAAVDSLTFSGTPAIGVSIGSGVIASGSDSFTLTLLQADAVTSSGAVDTDALAAALELTGSADLVSDYDLSWDEASGTLTFSGSLNTTAASGLAGQDASLLADTLWSSVSSVASFARTAAEQGKLAGVRSSRLWGAGLGHFTSMPSAGSLSGFSYNGGGYALGADMATGKGAVAGVAFGQMFGTHKSDNSMLSDKQRAFMFALYGNVRQELDQGQELNLSGYFSYGSVDHTARTHVGGSRQTPGRAKWDDDVYAFGLLADWNIKVSDTMTVAPFTGITYMYGSRGAIAETFDGGSRSFGNGSLQTWSIPVGVTLKSVWGLSNGQSLLPEVSVAYVGDIARRNPYARTWSAGQAVTGKGHNPGRNALMTRAGLGWQISKNWQTGAYYTLEVRSGQTNQSASINASYSF
ncbi:MAG: hypothetical protein LUE08_06755 [Akkermansiaceae bacterium]|nr:hypothetical protein [Akkermansiaceae bacterium]